MHVHLTNCHGEWTTLAIILAHAPLVGLWVRTVIRDLVGGSRDLVGGSDA